MRLFTSIFCLLLTAAVGYADGLIVEKSKNGIAFVDAISVNVNDKDKALNLGSQPRLSGPPNKLPQVRLSATLIKDNRSGTVALYGENEQPQYLLPLGVPKNTQPNPADVWKSARLTYRKSQSEKTPVELPGEGFVAFLPDGLPGLVSLCMDVNKLGLIGGSNGYFPAQIEIVAATVKAFGSNPAMASIDHYIRDTMRASSDRFDKGINSAKSLDEGLQFAKLSEQAYPADTAHQQLRKALMERKAWLDRRMAILRGLYAASEWDAYLIAYRDFEKHQTSFQDMRNRRLQALQESLKSHWTLGKERMGRREYGSAYRELRLASVREPSNAALQKDLAVAWSEYSREVAGSRRAKRTPLTPGQQDAVAQAIHFATRYREENKLDEALKSVTEGEAIDSENLALLLKKAEIYAARGEFRQALVTLDKYDTVAVDEERAAGLKLRNEVTFQVTNVVHEQKAALENAWARQRYNLTRQIARNALRADDRDPDILYFAGLSSLVTRDSKAGQEFLAHYLEYSNTSNTNDERRITALRLVGMAQAQAAKTSDEGEPNWFSGKRLPPDIAYCPISLAFSSRVDRIDASNKLAVHYEWNGPHLREIIPSFEKPQNATGETPIEFTYEDSVPQVIALEAQGGVPFTPSSDRDDLLKKSTVVLINSPLIDPIALERVTGTKVAMVTAGNRYFHPFVWQKLHYFLISYDDSERVRSAHEIGGPGLTAGGGEVDVEFDWDGPRLTAVRAYAQSDGGHSSPIYERRQVYEGGRLVAEEIKGNGKASRIKYAYEGSTLVSAHCDKDETIDNRSRTVFFTSAHSRRR